MAIEQDRITSLFQRLGRELKKVASERQAENVHQFRTATRRVEAVVQELVPEQDRNLRKLMKKLAKLRRRAGRVRDLDVLLANVRDLKVSDEPGRKAQLLRALSDLRSRREEKLVAALDDKTVRQIRKRLKRAEATVSVPGDKNPVAIASAMFARMASGSQPLTADALHQYRIKGKRIRYIAELGVTPEAEKMVAELKRMQDAIGEWHDWLTLLEAARDLWQEQRPSPLRAAIHNIARDKFREAIQVVQETKSSLMAAPALVKVTTGQRKPSASERLAASAIA